MTFNPWTVKELKEAIQNSRSYKEVYEHLGTNRSDTKRKKMKLDIEEHNISIAHFSSHKFSDEMLASAVVQARNFTDLVKVLGAGRGGSSINYYKKRVRELGLDTSHFQPYGHSRGKKFPGKRRMASDIFGLKSDDAPRTRGEMLRRALREVGVEEKCDVCGLGPEWQGRPLVLQVDHVNGNSRDDRRENLRFLCPNCHTQTPTYGNRGVDPAG